MPRGRPRKSQIQENPQEEAALRGQEAVERRVEDVVPEAAAQEGQDEYAADASPERESAVGQVFEEAPEESATVDPQQYMTPSNEEIPETAAETLTENFREDILAFMQNFGISGHQPESVFDAAAELKGRLRGEQSAARSHAGQQEQVPAPDELQSPVPLNVRITSLEIDGATRAFAVAEYGELTINRIRVKEDEYGTLSAVMPRYRQANGWRDTCRFNTVEARNRLTGTVLDAYEQKLMQFQGQNQTESGAPEQDEIPDIDGQARGGLSMSMGPC